MNYAEFLESNKGKSIGEPVSVDIHTWERDGDVLIGLLKSVDDFEGGNFEQKCKRYLFSTDDGLKSTILGASVDKQIDPERYIGRILMVTFKGKIQLDDGRQCNRFTVVDVTDAYLNAAQKVSEKSMEEESGGTLFDKIGKKRGEK